MAQQVFFSGVFYGYIRVSSQKQVKYGYSMQTQLQEIKNYCIRHNITSINLIEEPAKSANHKKIEKRVGLNLLIQSMQPGDTIIVYTMSRLCRSVKEYVFIKDMVEKKYWNLIFIDKDVDTRTAQGRFQIGLWALLGELEIETVAERNAVIRKGKRERGEFIGKIGYGWKFSNGPGSPVIEVEEEQKIIQFIHDLKNTFDDYGNAYTNQSIANKLNNIGVKPPRKSQKWYSSTIHSILNPKSGPALTKEYKKIQIHEYEGVKDRNLPIIKKDVSYQVGLNFY